jgi:hypothetical protein
MHDPNSKGDKNAGNSESGSKFMLTGSLLSLCQFKVFLLKRVFKEIIGEEMCGK